MAPEDEDLAELEAADVQGANRSPSAVQRVQRAPGHFASGTILPRIRGLLNPSLFRERGDTNRLVDNVLGEDGALSRLAATNPELVNEIRQQADSPMTPGEHQKFRSALLGMVTEEVAHNDKVKYRLADNQGFFEAFRQLDGFLPGAGNDQIDTREEYERRSIETLYKQAQEAALIDPDHSATLMGEVRKKADALTEGVRTMLDKRRRVAEAEDSALWSGARERLSETSDVIKSLQNDLDEKGLRRNPNETLIARANALLGQAGNFPNAGVADAAEGVASVIPDTGSASVVGDIARLAGKAADKALQASDVQYLIKRLEFNGNLIQQSYIEDRMALADKYRASGLQFGEKPGEVYAVPNEAYQKAAANIKAAPKRDTDNVDSLRGMLGDEVAAAQAAVDKAQPEASANVPGAAARLIAARERLQIAKDDQSIFMADQAEASGKPFPATEGDDAAAELVKARQRRAVREQQRTTGLVRQATMEALRGYTR